MTFSANSLLASGMSSCCPLVTEGLLPLFSCPNHPRVRYWTAQDSPCAPEPARIILKTSPALPIFPMEPAIKALTQFPLLSLPSTGPWYFPMQTCRVWHASCLQGSVSIAHFFPYESCSCFCMSYPTCQNNRYFCYSQAHIQTLTVHGPSY